MGARAFGAPMATPVLPEKWRRCSCNIRRKKLVLGITHLLTVVLSWDGEGLC